MFVYLSYTNTYVEWWTRWAPRKSDTSWSVHDNFLFLVVQILPHQHIIAATTDQHKASPPLSLPVVAATPRFPIKPATNMSRTAYSPSVLNRLVTNASLRFWDLHPHTWQMEAVTSWLDQTVPSSPSFPTVNLLCRAVLHAIL